MKRLYGLKARKFLATLFLFTSYILAMSLVAYLIVSNDKYIPVILSFLMLAVFWIIAAVEVEQSGWWQNQIYRKKPVD